MRWSPAEPAAISCRGAWKHLRSHPTVRITASDTLPVDQRVPGATVHCGDGGHLENPGSRLCSAAVTGSSRSDACEDTRPGWGIHGDPPAGARVLDIAQPVPDQPADVELVVQDSAVTGGVARDRARAPGTAVRTYDRLAIQSSGQSPWPIGSWRTPGRSANPFSRSGSATGAPLTICGYYSPIRRDARRSGARPQRHRLGRSRARPAPPCLACWRVAAARVRPWPVRVRSRAGQRSAATRAAAAAGPACVRAI